MKTTLFIILFIIPFSGILAQDSGIEVTHTIDFDSDCNPVFDIQIALENPETPDWELPYEIDLEKKSDDTETYYDMVEPNLEITGVEPGEYKIIIYLDDDCLTSFDITLEPVDVEDLLTETVTADCEEDGSIELDMEPIAAPSTILWADGNTSSVRDGLVGGLYSVTVTDGNGCEIKKDITVPHSSPITAPLVQHINPSNCFTATGEVFFRSGAGGGMGQKTYSWSNGATTLHLQNVFPGDYTLTVSDEGGCTKEFFYTVPGEQKPELELSHIKHACINSNIGSLVVGVPNLELQEISYLWDNGSINPYRVNLSPGEYCLTVTNITNGCFTKECYNIESLADEPIVLGGYNQLEIPCEGLPNGIVEIDVTGGATPYFITWDNGSGSSNSLTKYNLEAGNYEVTIKDKCEEEISMNVLVDEHDISFELVEEFVDCGDDEFYVTVLVEGDNPPFIVKWQDGLIGNTRLFKGFGRSFTVYDNGNCMINGVVPRGEGQVRFTDEVKTCEGVSTGSLSGFIINQNLEVVSGRYRNHDCDTCPWITFLFPTSENDPSFVINNLTGNQLIDYEISIGSSCVITGREAVGVKPPDIVFNRDTLIDETHFCIFDEKCDTIFIPSVKIEPAKIDFENAGVTSINLFGASNCADANLTCHGDSVGVLEGNSMTMRGFEAIKYYRTIGAPAPFDFFNEDPCAYYSICPYNGGVITRTNIFPYGGEFQGNTNEINDSCFEVVCHFPTVFLPDDNYIVCDFEGVSEELKKYFVNPQNNCQDRITKNVGQLHTNMSNFIDIDGFLGSELHSLLTDAISDPIKWCAKVSYCLDDFSVLYSNLNVLDDNYCGTQPDDLEVSIFINDLYPEIDFDDIVYCEPLDLLNGETLVLCNANNCKGCYDVLSDSTTLFNLTVPNYPNSCGSMVLPDKTTFKSFQKSINDNGFMQPKAYCESDDRTYAIKTSEDCIKYLDSEDVIFNFEDYRTLEFLTCYKDGNVYNLASGQAYSSKTIRKISSTSYLEILDVRNPSSGVELDVITRGVLKVGDEILHSNNSSEFVTVMLTKGLDIFSTESTIKNISSVDEFKKNYSKGKYLSINAATKGNQTITQNEVSKRLQVLDVVGNVKIEKYKYETSRQESYIIATGSGSLTQEKGIKGINQDSLYILKSGSVKQTIFALPKAGIITSDISISTMANGESFLSFSMDDDLWIGSHQIEKTTKVHNTCIIKMDENLNPVGYNVLGTDNKFVLKDICSANGVINFGGDVYSHNLNLNLGRQTFKKVDTKQQAFVSHIYENDLISLSPQNKFRSIVQVSEILFNIYPNPVNNTLFVEAKNINRDIDVTFEIFNIDGQHIKTIKGNGWHSKISLNDFKTGVYIIKVKEDGKVLQTERVVRI